MTQHKPVPHVHQAKINEWAADPSAVWQFKEKNGNWNEVVNPMPSWRQDVEFRRKPRWFDMEQDWISRGKPPVEIEIHGQWIDDEPKWHDEFEYRFKEEKQASRHADLKAEWERRGQPQMRGRFAGEWELIDGHPAWMESVDYDFIPLPHPDADVLRALAEDGSLDVYVLMPSAGHGDQWVSVHQIAKRFRINPKGHSND